MNITVSLELDDVTFEAEFWVERIVPAKLYGDNAHPAEGGAELKWLRCYVLDGNNGALRSGQTFECAPGNFPYIVEELTLLAEDEYYFKTERWINEY